MLELMGYEGWKIIILIVVTGICLGLLHLGVIWSNKIYDKRNR